MLGWVMASQKTLSRSPAFFRLNSDAARARKVWGVGCEVSSDLYRASAFSTWPVSR